MIGKQKKYNIVVNSSLKIQNKERSEYYEFDKEFYFDSKRSIIKRKTASTQDKDIKNNIVKGFKVKNEALKSSLMDNMKNSDNKKN